MSSHYYEILGVPVTASPDEIKTAYRALASKFHPDRNRDSSAKATRRMQEINAAYAVLSDPAQRLAYDEQLRADTSYPIAEWKDTAPLEDSLYQPEASTKPTAAGDVDIFDRLLNGAIRGSLSNAVKISLAIVVYWLIQLLVFRGNSLSGSIFGFQIAILISTVLAGTLLGFGALKWIAIGWTLWTLFFVFKTWLSILQLTTIGASFLIALNILNCNQYLIVRRVILTGFTTVLVGLALLVYLEPNQYPWRTNERAEAATAPSAYQPSPPISSPRPGAARPKTEDELFEETVSRLEAEFPMLNEKSQRFDSRAVDRVLALMQTNVARGMKRHEAIERAARQVMADPNPATGTIYRCKNNVYQDYPCSQESRP